MRAAPSPASSPADQTGDRPNRSQAAARKARARRMALEALEPRALMSVLPLAPIKDPQLPTTASGLGGAGPVISNDSNGNPGNDSSPQIAVDRYNPNKLVAVWTDHNIAGNPEPQYEVKGATSIDGGLTWTALGGLPAVRSDPSSGNNPHPYDRAARPTVAFDAKDNFYVLEVQENIDQVTAGDVVMKAYNFNGAAPVPGQETTVYHWDRTATVPILLAVRDATMAVDDNLPSFTDPQTGITQTDPGSGRIYIAWEDDVPVPTGYPAALWNLNSIDVLTSVGGVVDFKNSNTLLEVGGRHAAGRGDYEADAAPRLAISQGTPDGTVAGGQVTVIYDDFHSAGAVIGSPTAVDPIFAGVFTPNGAGLSDAGRHVAGSTSVRGAANSPYALTTPSTPIGIGPGAVIASDNTLGNSPHAGRLYVAYTDRYDAARFPGRAANNPADNTDIFVKYSDDGGTTWHFSRADALTGKQIPVNDDNGLVDGFTAADTYSEDVAGNLTLSGFITGRPQYMPQIAVDPATGTLAVTYEDTRYDSTKSRTVESVQISSGTVDPATGNLVFSAANAGSGYADASLTAYDETTQTNVVLGPVPSNQFAAGDPSALAQGGLGDRSGLAIYDGRLYVAYASNLNGGSDTTRKTQIHVQPMLYGTGPRVVSSTQGVVGARTVTDANGNAITFNNQTAADGTPIVDGFVVTFDRPVDAATFTRGDISVTYRDPFTTGSTPGIPEPISSDPVPLRNPTTGQADGTTFLVRFPGQSNVGTYSYTVGPNIRDLSRNTLATNLWYADQSAGNLPAIPPVGSGGSGIPAQDDARSVLTISGVPANQGILDLDVLVSLQHPSDGDLTLKLFPPPGYNLASPGYILLTPDSKVNPGWANGADFSDTTFDDQAARGIAGGSAPFTGHFRPRDFNAALPTTSGLGVVDGKNPNGVWTLEIDDNRQGNAGRLLSWGLKVTTSNRSFATLAQAGVAALSPTPGGGGLLSAGHLMDQNGDGLGGENPNAAGNGPPGSQPGSEFVGLAPGDLYAVPTPDPTTPEVFNGQNINPPFSGTTLPLQIAGPHVVRSFVPGPQARTADNRVTDAAVPGFDFVFDRNMDPNSLIVGQHVVRFSTPYGTFAPGDRLPDGSTLFVQVLADPNADPLNPNSDPDPAHPRTYQVRFFKQTIDPNSLQPVFTPFPQTESGNYSVTLASDVQSQNGDPLDTNQNAGLDFLRGTASAGNQPQTYNSQAPVPLGPGPVGTTYTSVINVPDSFLVKNVTLKLNIAFPQDNLLTAVLVAPDGFAVTLFSGVGNVGNGQNFTNTVLDDAAFTPIANGGPPFFGSFNPMQPLSQFKDHFSLGAWRLQLTVAAAEATAVGQITDWSLTLAQPLSNSGLGEPVADQATQSFRIFTFDPASSLSSNSFTAVGPAGEGAKAAGGNAEVAGRVGAIAVDPSDPSGNTVFVAGASGGIWKTRNFLTTDAAGPTYFPLTDNATTGGLNIGSIAVFGRNNDPNQSIIFAATGDASAAGDPSVRGQMGTQRGLGFLRSMDGGATWTLLDSRNNAQPFASRDHFFASVPGQAGVTSYKITVDPRLTANGQVVVYAALSDIDAGGNLVGSGPKGGIWKSLDSGQTWTLMKGGQATDLTLDYKSQNRDSGNLDFLYAAFRGDGVYFSPNAAQNFDLMTGQVGDPLIQDVDPAQPQPVPVRTLLSPNGPGGRIVLAKPALTGNDLSDKIYQGWLYAAVVGPPIGDDVENVPSGFAGLYLTKDFGQTWTFVQDTVLTAGGAPWVPTTTINNPITPISGSGTKVQPNFALGNFALSLAVDPNNANVVYLGGTDEFQPTGLIRIDTTGIHDAHAFYLDDAFSGGVLHTNLNEGVGLRSPTSGPYTTFPASLDPITQPNINLIRDPGDPFNADATILVHNTASFGNAGGHVKQIRFDRALAPDPFAPASDPWSVPTRDVHQILTLVDPLTGKSRFLFATDQGVYTAVADSNGVLIGSLGGQTTLNTAAGDERVVNGSRNGNLAIAEVYQGAAQPSQLAANVAAIVGFFYGNTQDVGISQSDPNVINKGTAGYGNLSGNVDSINGPTDYAVGPGGTIDRGTGKGLATQQTYSPTDAGTVYAYRISEDLVGLDGVGEVGRPSTDTVQVNTVGKTFRLYQTSNGGNTPDAQWPFRQGYNLIVNPLSADQMLISSQAGRVFATTTRGNVWSEIGNPGALDGSNAEALAYGAPDPAPAGGGLGALNNYILAGTANGNIFVTFTAGGGSGNQWANITNGALANNTSPVQQIVTDPTRGSHDAYAITKNGVYHITDTRSGTWQNVTGNLFSVQRGQFGDASLGTVATLQYLTSIQADWRYLIPDDFANPGGSTHPMLYAGGQGGVFRSYDGGQSWALFPDGAVNADGTANPASLLNSPLGNGGGLPNAQVTDLDLSLGNVDPTTGRPDVSTGPNVLLASTFGRGQFGVRLAPIVFPNTSTNSAILHLSTTAPVPPGTSDTGFANNDGVTSSTTPVIEGLSEQSAFGNTVHVALFDVSTFTQAEINSLLAGTPTRLPTSIPVVAGTDATDATGHFAVQVAPGYFRAFDPNNPTATTTDGPKRILVQAVNGSGTKGNFAPLGKLLVNNFGPTGAAELGDPTSYSFILDTTPPVAPSTPVLQAVSDSGLSQTDDITNVTANLKFSVTLSVSEPSTTRVYLVRDSDSNVVDTQFGTAAPGTITLTDPGPVSDGAHLYYAYEIDLAGNKGPISGKLRVVVDTVAPARPNPPVLDPSRPAGGSDSGIVGDNITNVKQPYLTGSAEAGGLAQIIDSAGNVLGPALGNPVLPNVDPTNGRYSIDPATPLPDGTYVLRVREEDVAGNFSQPSAPITVTILSRTPATPTLALVAADDSGIVGDDITNVTQPRLVGAATPGLAAKLVLDSGTIYDANGNPIPSGGVITSTNASGQAIIVAPDGSYQVKFPRPLADGVYVVHSVVSDVAGNFAPSAPLTLTIAGGGVVNPQPTPTPGAPVLALDPRDDTPPVGDFATTNTQPRLDGSAAVPGGTVQLILDSGTILGPDGVTPLPTGSVVGPPSGAPQVVVQADGTFVVQFANRLSTGNYVVHALISGGAGGPVQSSRILITVRNLGLATPTLSLSPADDTGIQGDNTTVVRRPHLIGTARYPDGTPAGNVNIELDDSLGHLLALTTTTTSGTFTISLPNDLVNGAITVVARVRDVAGNPGPASAPLTLHITSVPGDANGDGKADLDSFSRTTSTFTLASSTDGANSGSAPFLTAPGDIPFQGDFDGDGKADYGFYRPSTAQWFLHETRGGNILVQFGVPNQTLPVPADYDGDNLTDFATYNTTTGVWTIFQSKTGTLRTASFGIPGDQPIPADFDGDGKADLAVYRPSTSQFFASFSSGATSGVNAAFSPPSTAIPAPNVAFGNPGTDVPVVADYNGDGKADVAVYRKTTGQWFIDFSSGGLQGIAFGQPGDIPVPADYDGDGKADFALFRPVNPATPGQGNWLILGSSGGGRILVAGAANDVPLLAPMQPYRVQSGGVVSRAVLGGPADFTALPAADLGRTALTLATGSAPAQNMQAVIPPQAFAARPRPAQVPAPARKAAHHHAPVAAHAHDAALEKLGHFKVKRHHGA